MSTHCNRYLFAQEELLSVTNAQIPQDHQASAVANQNLPWLLRVFLKSFHRPQRFPTSVVIWQTGKMKTNIIHYPTSVASRSTVIHTAVNYIYLHILTSSDICLMKQLSNDTRDTRGQSHLVPCERNSVFWLHCTDTVNSWVWKTKQQQLHPQTGLVFVIIWNYGVWRERVNNAVHIRRNRVSETVQGDYTKCWSHCSKYTKLFFAPKHPKAKVLKHV